MELMLNKMRADFAVVAEARKAAGEWSAEDIKEFTAAIKAAIDGKDMTAIALWSRWLSDLATGVVFFNMIIRATEAGMRVKAAEERAKEAGV